jgi:hypothetical protein
MSLYAGTVMCGSGLWSGLVTEHKRAPIARLMEVLNTIQHALPGRVRVLQVASDQNDVQSSAR